MAAVTAGIYASGKTPPAVRLVGQLKQANVLVNDLAHRPHIVSTLLLPARQFPLPLAYWQLTNQIKTGCVAIR